ncbi:RUS family member 1 isoform X1 [Microplitis demolitor]|uniref:RUS family member 1 isoform X1 n=1 Tax=Microplitis demolitor TaxID=69319 RepID=UPI0006D51F38|nr:RUS family member 1 isoform X1 [Microplitis demolitor]
MSSHECSYQEIYGNDEKTKRFIKLDHHQALKRSNSIIKYGTNLFNFKSFLKEIFLPQGFPHSVHPDYISYQISDTIQAFASTILGTLTTHSILQSVGVGESTATSSAAAISWILKDGTGMIGRILFTWWKSTELDAQCKKWRLTADILNDLAMGIELTLPYTPSSVVTILLCLSTAMKSIVGVAGGATRAALTQHQALVGNLADVSAKDASQETFINLIGSFVGIFILTYFPNTFLIEMYIFLVTVHIYANYFAVKALTFNTLNENRLILLLNNYIVDGTIHNTKTINHQEPILFFNNRSKKYCGFNIKLGVSLSTIVQSNSMNSVEYLTQLLNHFYKKTFLIIPDAKKKVIYVVLKKNVHSVDIFQAYFNAYIYGKLMSLKLERQKGKIDMMKSPNTGFLNKLYTLPENDVFNDDKSKLAWKTILSIDTLINKEFEHWYGSLKKSEWKNDTNLLPINNWRGKWDL